MNWKLFVLLMLLLATGMQSFSQRTRIRKNLDRVIQQLNDSLRKYDERGRTVHLLSDSVFSVKNKDRSFITVNIKKLYASKSDSLHQGGIDFIPINHREHVPGNWIYFHQSDQMTRLMFQKATEEEAKRLYKLFVEMRSYMQELMK
jgi:type II secretory pathway pseudopilin PulG